MKNRALLRALAILFLAGGIFAACGGDEPTPPPPPPAPPSFSIASVPATLTGGQPGIQFFATPNEDVVLVKVEIKPPVGNAFTFNLGSSTVISGQSFGLQDSGRGYTRVSGTWAFTFTGNKASGTRDSFVTASSVNVSAKNSG